MKKIIFSTVVWGRQFTNLFANFSLPALLAPGNLPAMANLAPLEYWIYTDQASGDWLTWNKAIIRLKEFATVKFFCIADETIQAVSNSSDAYKVMVETHRHSVSTAWLEDAALCFHDPDRILADGSLAAVAARVLAGARAVSGSGLSVVTETFCPALLRQLTLEGRINEMVESDLRLEPREILPLAIDHLHDHTGVQVVDQDRFTTWPSVMCWPLADRHGYLIRTWHLVPIFIHPRRDGSSFTTSTDGDFIARAVDWEDCSFIEDSDDFLLLEPVTLTRRRNHPPGINRIRAFDVAHWALNNADKLNRRFVRCKFWIHDGKATDRAAVEAQSDAFLDEVFSIMGSVEEFAQSMEQNYTDLTDGISLTVPLGWR